jgi:hypothetical protein
MANVFEDFDKRQEHGRRFAETQPDGKDQLYSAPKKASPAPKVHHFHSELQKGLLEALLDLGENPANSEKRRSATK